jgi:hypothetical protein
MSKGLELIGSLATFLEEIPFEGDIAVEEVLLDSLSIYIQTLEFIASHACSSLEEAVDFVGYELPTKNYLDIVRLNEKLINNNELEQYCSKNCIDSTNLIKKLNILLKEQTND